MSQKPFAYSYELACAMSDDGEYSGWKEFLSKELPSVPKASIRNLVGLFTFDKVPAPVASHSAGASTLLTLISAALNHSGETCTHAFVIPVPNTNPALVIAMGEREQIAAMLGKVASRNEREGLTDFAIEKLATEARQHEAMEFSGSTKVASHDNVVWAIRRALAARDGVV